MPNGKNKTVSRKNSTPQKTAPSSKKQAEPRVKRPPITAVDIARDNTKPGWRAWFSDFAKKASTAVGSPITFLAAIAIVVMWGVSGPMFGFSDTWQLVINTGTTIITFLMVFLIQNTQNRDAKALHFKLDELIHAVHGAHEELIDVEDLTDEELEELAEHYHKVREERAGRRIDKSDFAVAKDSGKKSKDAA
ncbi:MAG TPA: low affinity iron permease family protein [Terriglobales bacterium]|nr:low affinity iron permease family protein [Terriglobales bacterium]